MFIPAPALHHKYARGYIDDLNPQKRAVDVSLTPLHYESEAGSGVYDTPVDLTINPVNNAQLNGWLANVADFHYALGQPAGKLTDGWVGYGGLQGSHWLMTRLARGGYLHWPTKAWDLVTVNAPNYNRANLSREVEFIDFGDAQITTGGVATWESIFTTPGGGRADLQWRINGERLKEEIVLNQAARTWITNNHPPATPANETYFGWVFQIDALNIPQWIINGIIQDITDLDDNGESGIELQTLLGDLIGFLPVSYGYVLNGNEVVGSIGLRKRLWFDIADQQYYLIVGARVDQLNALPQGTLVFDPTVDVGVSASDEDAHEESNGTNFSSTSTVLRADSHTGSGRFFCESLFAVTGPTSGVTVDVAYVTVHANSTSFDDANVDMYCEDVDGAADFTANPDVTSRTRTTGTASWIQDGIGTGAVNSPSLVTPVQEVFDRPGWASGNLLGIFFDGRSDAIKAFRMVSYDSSTVNCWQFHLEYTVPSTNNNQRLPLLGVS